MPQIWAVIILVLKSFNTSMVGSDAELTVTGSYYSVCKRTLGQCQCSVAIVILLPACLSLSVS